MRDLAETINTRLQDPEFVEYYQGISRSEVLDKEVEEGVKSGDKKRTLDAQHASFINDLIMFQKAGKLDAFMSTIDANIKTYDTTDPNAISELADDIRESARDQKTNISAYLEKSEDNDRAIVEQA
jgi:hypothetical protein